MNRLALWLLCLVLMPLQTVLAAIAVDSVSSDSSPSNQSSLSFNHTVGNGSERYLLVAVSFRNEGNETVSSVSFGSQNLTRITSAIQSNDSRVEIWQLVNPSSGSGSVQVNFNANVRGRGAGAISFTGVDQSSPYSGVVTAGNESGTASLTVSSASGDLVFAVMAAEEQGGAPSTSSSGMTSQWTVQENGNQPFAGAGATKAGAGSVAMSWSLQNNDDWAAAGLSINASGSSTPLPAPTLDYRFDDCTLGAGATDSAGSNDGTAYNAQTTDSFQVINRALDLSDNGTTDRILVPSSAVNNLNDFSISTWIRTSTSKTQQEIFQALGGDVNDDEIEIYIVNSSQVQLNVRDSGTTVNAGTSLTDGNWHHLLVARSGSQMCLYVDGGSASCHNSGNSGSISVTNSAAVVIGQEQDAYNGSFSTSQNFVGQIDEFKIYASTLDGTHANQIYTNENAGRNADDDTNTRPPVSCGGGSNTLVAEYRFDEAGWNGTANEVLDQTENNNHGSLVDIVGGSGSSGHIENISDGKICWAGNIDDNTAANSQYAIDTGVDINSLGNEGSISLWYRHSGSWNSGGDRIIFNATSGGSDDKYFFLRKNADGRLRYGLEDTSDNDYQYNTASAFSFGASDWVHLVATWDMPNGQMRLYVNGNQVMDRDISSNNGNLGNMLSLYLGDNRVADYTAGAGANSTNGDIDEVLIFDNVLSQASVTDIYTNQNAGNNYDGTARGSCPVAFPVPVLDYRFDESQWQGTSGEVKDSSPNADHGTAQGGANTVDDNVICRSGSFDGVNDFVQSVDLAALRTTASLSFWIKTDQVGSSTNWLAPGISGVEQSGGTNDIFWGWLDLNGNIGLTVGDDTSSRSTTSLNDDQWHHVVLTRDATTGAYQIFIDGSLNRSGTSASGTISTTFDSFARVRDTGGTDTFLRGLLDEVLVFDQVLTQNNVTELYDNQRANPPRGWDGNVRDESNCSSGSQQWEGGSVDVTINTPTTINFSQTYVNPVLFLLPENQSADPTNARVVSVSANSAQIIAVEPPNENNSGLETVNFIVAERGVYTLSGGAKLEVGVVDVSALQFGTGIAGTRSWQAISFNQSFTSTPALITELQSRQNGSSYNSPWLYSAASSLTLSGFNAALGRAEVGSGSVIQAESYAYLAVDKGALPNFIDSASGTQVTAEALSTGNVVTHLCYTDNLTQSYNNSPNYVAAINTLDGSDGGWTRGCGSSGSTVSVFVQEDLFLDTDFAHTTEDISILVFDAVGDVLPLAEWRFDEANWSAAGDVKDSRPNNYDGTAFVTTPDANTKQICRAADFTTTGTSDYIALDGRVLSNQADFSISAWVRTNKTSNQALLSGADNGSFNELIMWFPNSTTFQPHLNNSVVGNISIPNIADNQWHHLVWTRSSGQNCIYVDGTRAGCVTESNPQNITIEQNGLILAQEQDSVGGGFVSSQAWEGHIDELLIYGEALTQAKIDDIFDKQSQGLNLDGTTRDCASSVAYYQISHSSPALTCEAATVTVTARDTDGNPIAPSSGTVANFSAQLVSGSNIVNTLSPTSHTFNGTDTSTTFNLIRTAPGELDIDVTDGSATDQDGQATDPNIVFADAAFRFYADGVVDAIGNQIAGKSNTVAPLSQAITIRAIQTDPATGRCEALTPGPAANVQFGYQCSNPNTCAGNNKLSVNGVAAAGFNAAATPVYGGNTTVSFDNTGTGSLVLNYADAGQIQVYAQADVPVTGGTGNARITGSSNAFVVRPFAFGFPSIAAVVDGSIVNNPGDDETGGDGFTAAGADFTVAVNAYLYDASEDTNNDGHPDIGADVTDNGVAVNFVGDVELSIAAFTPASGTQGTLFGSTTVSLDNSGGGVSTILTYSEVGSISLRADHDNYQSVANFDITSDPEKVGRFYPDHFVLNSSNITAACTPESDFTYMQQPFSAVAFQAEARNVGGVRVQNYDNNSLGYFRTANFDYVAEDSNDGVDLTARVSEPSTSQAWVNGQYNYSSNAVIFGRAGSAAGLEDGPLSQLQLGVTVEVSNTSDADGRVFSAAANNMNPGTSNDCGVAGNCTAATVGNAQRLLYGRVRTESAHGPETENLPVPFVTEYWNGTEFVTNEDDSCTAIPLTGISFDGNAIDTTGNRTVTVGDGSTTGALGISGTDATATQGSFNLQFSAPGAGAGSNDNTGYFPVGVNTLAEWLRYDWDADGNANDAALPDAIVTFGRARGNDRMIFWQERYQ